MANRIFNTLLISVFTSMIGLGVIYPLIPTLAKNMGATGLYLGLVISAFSISRLILMPIIGRLSDKHSKKKFILTGLFLYSACSLLYLLAENVFGLVLARLLQGVSSAMVVPVAMAYIAQLTKHGKEGKTMGTFSMALFLGWATGPLLGGFVNQKFGFNAVFYCMAIFALIAFSLCLFLLPDIKIGLDKENKIPLASFRKIIFHSKVLPLIIFRIFSALGRGGIMAFIPLYAAKINIPTDKIGIIISLNVYFMAIFQRPFGKLADRFNRFHLVLIGMIVMAASLFLIPSCKNFIELVMVNCLLGLGGAISMSSSTAMAANAGRSLGMGSTMGIFSTAMSIGMTIAPLIAGIIFDLMGINFLFTFFGASLILGTIIIYIIYNLMDDGSETEDSKNSVVT
ncbi:MAG: MFS transporter [Pseudomonadota bacterium]